VSPHYPPTQESGSVQGSSSSSSLLQKIMTPANNEYDTGSLKRRDPRKMFTDSSFYSAKHHPTVADQVEMAHKLSSAMFNEKNKSTKGQQMFLSRVQNSGEEEVLEHGDPNKIPNLKHVMNPEGRMTEWDDVTEDNFSNAEMMAAHAAPIPNTPDPIAESLLAEAGKGEASLSRPSTFVSAYRRVFEQNRTVFGAQQDAGTSGKSCESPRLEQKGGVGQDTGHMSTMAPKPVQPSKNIPSMIASPNLNKNRVTAPKSVTIVDTKASKDSSIGRVGGKDTAMIEMRPVTVRVKEPSEPSAPPRKAHHNHNYLASPGAKQADNRKTVAPSSLNPTVPHFIESQKQPLDNQKFATKALDNRAAPTEQQVLDNGHSVRRHASFNEKSGLDNRQPRTVWENNNNLNQMTRPGDVLRTPYLLSSSSRALNHHQSSQNVVGNFPHIPGTSMVAKTKALFEGAGGPSNFAPLTKSRTFSSFPTNRSLDGPGTPSVPARKSSRKVFEDYKSMNGNMNDCGMDSTPSSPMTQRRIPMANFF